MLTEVIEQNKNLFPNKIVLEDENESLTFSEFVSRAKALGTEIAKLGYKNRAVAVEAERSVHSVIGFFAAVYSGNFFMPVDPGTPALRLQKMIERSMPIAFLSVNDDGIFKNLNPIDIKSAECLKIDEMLLAKVADNHIDIDPCYMIWTSGSTGDPKGVLINHGQAKELAYFLKKILEIEPTDILGNQSPFYFDGAMKDIFLFGYYGVKLVIIPKKYFALPVNLVEFLNKTKVNVLLWAVSALNILVNSKVLESENLKYVNKVTFAGESMQTVKLNYLRKKINACFTNLYGPSETAVDCAYYKVNRDFSDTEPIPIGKAFPNMELFLVDENHRETFCKGEIVVRGSKISCGYYRDHERTDKAFIQDPRQNFYRDIVYLTGDIAKYNENGELVFLSRADDQIKHMGSRIELGEIETAISSMRGIHEGACIYDGENSLIVYFYSGEETSRREIFKFLRGHLPKYMFPNVIKKLDVLPKNRAGKIDRLKLMEIYEKDK